MKKKMTLPLIIISSVVAAILVAVIVLCCINVRPLKPFTDYNSVRIITATNSNLVNIDSKVEDDFKKEFDKGLKKSGFSVMHAMLEFVYSYGPKFEYKTVTNDKGKEVIDKDDNGNKIKKEMTYAEVAAACAPSDSAYVLEFEFGTVNTVVVNKEDVKFDHVRMSIGTTNGEVKWITVYPYIYDMTIGEGNPDVEEYRINPITLRANTSSLYISLNKIAQDVKTA